MNVENVTKLIDKDHYYEAVITYLHIRMQEMENRICKLTNFGDWSISEEFFKKITEVLPKGKTILELGSGQATQELSHYGYKVYSIEHDGQWLNRYYTNYIYAPLGSDGWYDANYLEGNIPEYDLLLIDGPKSECRNLMINYLCLFDLSKIIMIDNFDYCVQLAKEITNLTGKEPSFFLSNVTIGGIFK